MNSKIKKLTCLSCGGQLSIDPGLSLTQCPYCGNVYLLKDLLDHTPSCPICNKNDRVVLAASITKHDQLYKALRFDIDDFHLPDEEDDLNDNTKAIAALGWLLVIIPIVLFQFFFSRLNINSGASLLSLIIAMAVGIGLLVYGANQYKAVKTKKEQKQNIRRVLKELNQKEYNRLKPIYDRLHYCRRDEIVFLPGQGDYSPPEQIREYLRKYA
jgi:predicted RNA-binding Zn-ribbon protein involved in translation (DUF1610 family)